MSFACATVATEFAIVISDPSMTMPLSASVGLSGSGSGQFGIVCGKQLRLRAADVELGCEKKAHLPRQGLQFRHIQEIDEGLAVLAEIDDRRADRGMAAAVQEGTDLSPALPVLGSRWSRRQLRPMTSSSL